MASSGGGQWDDAVWAEWAVGLTEPGIDPEDRLATLRAMEEQARANRSRALILLSGALTDILDSLPDTDPWRSVDPERFGTWRDGTDLVPKGDAEVREDVGLAALARPLGREAAELMAQTRHGWEAVARAAQLLDEPVRPLTRAITWATWRRRAYEGGDHWPVMAVFLWIRLSQRAAAGEAVSADRTREWSTSRAKLSDDLYFPVDG